ncbi:hypothetical protein ACFQI7_26765 [Paenibacillus allorhizosphaerae]|uniref:Mandelate racemase/muconate lactonizing enzyme N-terminal domain-containing protein n=1 Tax=Paenibacillus allorhizosphaerae TaxID=2849866 RepID=A0ABN7TP00_9BACL|nr:hypothetical protein [Paenibacillus allorhizosphaerae]CAG7649276.1 hypothetical protein PAECIP111802_04449 [Paenibacillus allorhizosphaerae]
MFNLTVPSPVINENELLHYRICAMEVFRFDCRLIQNQIPLTGGECNCGLLKISSGGVSGWGEYVIPCTRENIDLVRWAFVFAKLKGLSIADAIRCVQTRDKAWGQARTNLAESALLDLAFKLRYPFTLQKDIASSLGSSLLIDRSQAYFSF